MTCFVEKENMAVFVWNEELQKIYAARHPYQKEPLIDFGSVPEDSLDRENWSVEVTRVIRALASRGYQCDVAMYDGGSGLCPLYTVPKIKRHMNNSISVDLIVLEAVVKKLCFPEQHTVIQEQVLGIQVLPDIGFWHCLFSVVQDKRMRYVLRQN